MNNYKIKVNNTNPKEYQEVLDIAAELGYDNEDWGNLYNLNYLFLNDDSSVGFSLNGEAVSDDYQELTLHQLRDLVVLHRKDVGDATHTDGERKGFLSSDGVEYFWNAYDLEWFKAKQMTFAYEKFKPIQEQGLISGADALKAMMEGKRVLYSGYKNQDWDTALNCNLGVFLKHEKFPDFSFKIVPRTIKLELEIPAPFEPKEKDIFWTLSTNYECGYVQILCYRNDEQGERLSQFGAWRTEEEIKQVVAALRGIKG